MAAVVVHSLVLAFVVLPVRPPDAARGTLRLVPVSNVERERTVRRPGPSPPGAENPESDTAGRRASTTDRRSWAAPNRRVAIPLFSPDAPASETIAETMLRSLADPVLPLEAGPVGARRRVTPGTAEALARMRAESLVNARLADLPGAGRPVERGPVSLANGGVTLAIPWQGFLPADRSDGEWRRARCGRRGGGDGDKAGEAEGRASQCG